MLTYRLTLSVWIVLGAASLSCAGDPVANPGTAGGSGDSSTATEQGGSGDGTSAGSGDGTGTGTSTPGEGTGDSQSSSGESSGDESTGESSGTDSSGDSSTATGDDTDGTSTGDTDTGTSGDDSGDGDEDEEPPCREWKYRGYTPPGFTLFFTDQDAAEDRLSGDCVIERISGVGPYLLGMTCDVAQDGIDPVVGVDIVLDRGGMGALAVDARVEFFFWRSPGWNVDETGFRVRATDETPGYEEGDILIGGVHGEIGWPQVGAFQPLDLVYGRPLCVEDPQMDSVWCIRETHHEVDATYFGETTVVDLREDTVIPGEPPLVVRVEHAQSFVDAWGECDEERSGPTDRTNIMVWAADEE